ncbi:hypothetical protein FJZ53_06580 [Candidatus Woesearchaeota archaeon]|nr:hypothetical protein [Candidatus Woesearchaeota archaeon]
MKMMKTKIAAGLTALMLGAGTLTGCFPSTPGKHSGEYNSKPEITQSVEQISELEGKIIKVQPSNLTYVRWRGSNTSTASNHEFEYVIVQDKNGTKHTLIYPYSKAILETEATLKYRSLNSGGIDVETFIDNFIVQEYDTDDNFVIEAEGIITKDGIKYK